MKRLFITVLLLIPCLGPIIANDYFWIDYADGTTEYYEADHTQTGFCIDSQYRPTNPVYSVHDDSIFEKSKKDSRADYDKLYEKINNTHSGVISSYDKQEDGQTIFFYKDKISKMYKYKR